MLVLWHGREARLRCLRLEDEGWFQYEFGKRFTCRSIVVTPDGANSQAHRLRVEASDDGARYRAVAQLPPPRHGWQSGSGPVTHSIPTTTARFFRFAWGKEGTEPGSEDLDAAKWSPVLKVRTVELLGEP